MGRLATPVPRHRRLRTPAARIPLSPTHATFEPYAAVFGPGGAVHEPGDTTAEKLAPGPAATKAAAHTPPPSKSGGSSGDLTIPGYQPATPTGSPYVPTEPGHSAQDFARAFAAKRRRELLGTLAPLSAPLAPLTSPQAQHGSDYAQQLLSQLPRLGAETLPVSINPGQATFDRQPSHTSPTRTAQENREIDTENRLVRRLESFQAQNGQAGLRSGLSTLPLPSGVKAAAAAAAAKPPDRSYTVQTPQGPVTVPVSSVKRNPQDPLGGQTLGNVTLAQLQQAAQAGTLKTKGGTLSTPANRQILHQLLTAHRTALSSRQAASLGLSAYGPEAERNARTVLGVGAARDEPRRALLAALETGIQESGFENLPISGPGGGWRQEETAFYDPSTITNVKKGAENFFNELDEIPGKGAGGTVDALAQEVQGSGAGATYYAQHQAEAVEALKAYEQGQPDALAAKQLVQAKHAAAKAGINPTPWNGDVQGGGSDYVWIRGDAAGAVHWAKSTLGTQEGSPKQRHWAELEALGPSEPWCADWVAVNLARRGVELPEGPNGSWSYEDAGWKGGTQLGTDPSVAKPGDLVVYGGGAHIAMYVGNGKVIAGNWGDEVAEYGVSEDSRGISAIVRPHYKGGKVKVKAGQLPGSSSESTFDQGAGGGGSEGTTEGGVAPTETSPAPVQPHGQAAAAALANFTVPTAPSYAATVATPEINGEQSAAQELLALLTRRDLSVNRA